MLVTNLVNNLYITILIIKYNARKANQGIFYTEHLNKILNKITILLCKYSKIFNFF